MNEEPPTPAAPELPSAADTRRAEPRSPRLSRRQTLIGVGGLAALLAGSGVYRWRTSASDAGLTEFSAHPSPRELGPLRFSDAQGAQRSLAGFLGRVVLLNVWATWCPPCREEMPTLDRLQAMLGGPGFEVVTVSIDGEGLPVVQAFFRQIGIRHLHPYIDTFREVGTLGAIGIPLTLLIDRDGREAARKFGPAAWDDRGIVATIRRHLTEGKRP